MITHSLAEGTSAGAQLNSALTTSVNPNTIVNQFVEILPWVGIAMIVAFVIYEARKLIKGIAKGKVRV